MVKRINSNIPKPVMVNDDSGCSNPTPLAQNVTLNIPDFSPSNTNKSKSKTNALSKYLVDEQNYYKFAEFLSTCFALENLLFFAKVMAFRHVLMDMLKQREVMEVNNTKEAVVNNEDTIDYNGEFEFYDEWCPTGLVNAFALKFKYIHGLYQSVTPNEKNTMYDIALDIYNTFISTDGLYQVNISGFNRHQLTGFFNEKTDDNARKIEDYLIVYNDSVIEVYDLLKTVYAFQFRTK